VIRAIVIACAVIATGCGSDTGPPAPTPARPVRIALLEPSAPLLRGVHDAERFVGAVQTADAGSADLVVTGDAARARAAAQRSPDAHVLLVGALPRDPVPGNLLTVEISRGQPAYLTGALAALTGAQTVAVVGGDDELAAAVRAGGTAAGAPLEVSVAACGAAASADVIYVERAECLSGDETGKVVAPELVDGADQLAVVGPRPWVAVAAAARAVQAGRWVPGVMQEGLRQDVLGISWMAPSVPAAAVDRLQLIEDMVRAGQAQIPVVAPVQQAR
jgi:basic membrane lipoprotein Med (substrate-binding protein (PBP1-ABC) superfamily)